MKTQLLPRKWIKGFVLLLFLVSSFFPFSYLITAGRSGYPLIYIAGAVCFVWLIFFLKNSNKDVFIDKFMLFIIASFFFIHLISIFWIEGDLFNSFWYFLRFFLGFIVFLFAYFSVEGKSDLFFYLKIILIAVVAQALLLITQRYLGSDIGVFQQAWTATEKYFIEGSLKKIAETGGTYANANYLMHWLVYGVFISLGFIFLLKKDLAKKSIYVFFHLITVIALIFSFSRAAWLGALIGSVFYIFLVFLINESKFRRKIILYLLAILIFFTSIFTVSSFNDYFNQKINSGSSYESRAIVNQLGWEIFWDHPFTGVGLDRQPEKSEYYKKYRKDFARAGYDVKELKSINLGVHNSYLLVAIEGGLFALALFLLALIGVMIRNISVFIRSSDQELRLLSIIFIAGFIAHFISIYWYVSIKFPYLWPVLWFFLGLGLANFKLWKTKKT